MTLKAAVDHLWQSAHRLRDETNGLRLAAVEDVPGGAQLKLVEDVGGAADALAGWVEGAVAEAASAVEGAGYPSDLGRVRHALDACGGETERAAAQLLDELASMRRLDELSRLGRRGPEYRAWVASVTHGVEQTQRRLWAVHSALIASWRELGERGSAGDPPSPLARTERS
jgi:hypothetical protein